MTLPMAGRRELLRALTRCLVPPATELRESSWEEIFAAIEEALASQPAFLRGQFRLFLAMLRWVPCLVYGARFDVLPPREQEAVLLWLQDNPLRLLRTGFWGLRTLVFMGYYGRAGSWGRLFYTPSVEGNANLHG